MSKTPVSTLQEYVAKNNLGLPEYVLVAQSGAGNDPTFKIKVICCGREAFGSSSTKKEAKHNAAKEMLKSISCSSERDELSTLKKIFSAPADSYYSPGFVSGRNDSDAFINSVGKLGEYCILNGLKNPEYSESGVSGPDHQRRFKVKCSLGHLSMYGEGKTKKDAKQKAAQNIHEELLRCPPMKRNIAPPLSDVDKQNCSDAVTERLKKMQVFNLAKIELSKSHTKALGIYPQLVTKKPVQNRKKIEIGDLHEMLNTIVTRTSRDDIKELLQKGSSSDKEKILNTITKLVDVDYEYKSALKIDGQYAVTCSLNTNPNLSDVGLGRTYHEAKDNAITNMLQTIDVLLSI